MQTTETTPFLLKNLYNRPFMESVSAVFEAVYPEFDRAAFFQSVFDAQWPDLELKQRMRHIVHALRKVLPAPYDQALAVVTAAALFKLNRDGDSLSFEWSILPDFVQAFGEEWPDLSIPALETVTQVASAEFAVRPFLLRYPERMYAQMALWSQHPNYWVRRLATEGMRPRLPWGMGVPALKKDPSPALPILERLKNDPAETVRRSVANHLNDISKDHPELALQLAERWLGQSEETDWVVRHACRGLLKKGDPTALRLFGFDAGQSHCKVLGLSCTPQVAIGQRLDFAFQLHNTGPDTEKIRVEYAVDYLTSSGKISRKVFMIAQLELLPGTTVPFTKYQRFQDFTTRKHYPGTHRLAILVNGVAGADVVFEVVR